MDKKLLDALNNLSVALESIVEALKSKEGKESKSATTEAMTSGNLDKNVLEINNGVKKLLEDNKKILSNQETILKISKSKQSQAVEEKVTFDEKKKIGIKDGLSIILMIAAGVLAIGLAFKIVGKVDFLSVIALSVALPLIAFAFEKISKVDMDPSRTFSIITAMALSLTVSSFILSMLKPISITQGVSAIFIAGVFAVVSFGIAKILKAVDGVRISPLDLIMLPLIMITMSAAIAGSSFFLSKVIPISISQGITSILIAGTFSAISFGLSKLLMSVKKTQVTPDDLFKLPIILVTMSLAIVGSSYVLQLVKPVGFLQLFTSLMISLTFVALSYSLNKILTATKNIKPNDVYKLPLVLVSTAVAIALSSIAFAGIVPITFSQFLTAAGIAIVFIPMSLSLPLIAFAISKIKDYSKLAMLPIIMGVMSLAIYGSSLLFSKIEKPVPLPTLISIGLMGITLAAIAISMSLAFMVIEKTKLDGKKVLQGSLVILAIATTIMISSLILGVGKYEDYPSLDWVMGVGLSLLAFGVVAVAVGLIASSGAGAVALGLGLLSILAISLTVVATSYILGAGNYSNYPSLTWALGVGLSLFALGITSAALALISPLILVGLVTLVAISSSVVATAAILSSGDYSNFPSLNWAMGVGASLLGFGLAAGAIGAAILLTLGIGYVGLLTGLKAIKEIANTVVEVSKILSTGTYGNYPSLGWSLGVGGSLMGFVVASKATSFFGIDTNSIKGIANAVVEVSRILSSGTYETYPGLGWSLGVGGSLLSFATTSKLFGLFGFEEGPIVAISNSIVKVSKILLGGNYTGGPSLSWSQGISAALGGFAPVYRMLLDSAILGSSLSPESFSAAMITVVTGIKNVAAFFNENSSVFDITKVPQKEWSSGVSEAIGAFMPALKYIQENDGLFSSGTGALTDGLSSIANSLVNVSKKLELGKFNKIINPNWIDNVKSTITSYVDLAKFIETNGADDVDISETVDNLVKLSEGYGLMAENLESLNSQINNIDLEKMSALRSLTGSVVLLSLMDPDQFENMMDALEEKSEIFTDVINNMKGESGGMVTSSITPSGGGGDDKKLIDLWYQLRTINNTSSSGLSSIQREVSALNEKVRELSSKMEKTDIKSKNQTN
jgi:hypothetical protein